MDNKPTNSWRKRIHEIIYEADTKAGKKFDILLLITIIISVILVVLESVETINLKYSVFLNLCEWVITILFSLEYIMRIILSLIHI